MTIEEHIQLHDQWLRSMESNHAQLAEDLGRVTEKLDVMATDLKRMKERQDAFEAAMTQYVTTITMNVAVLAESQARASTRHERLEEAHEKLAEEVGRAVQSVTRLSQEMASLRDLVERYIRAQGDGGSRN